MKMLDTPLHCCPHSSIVQDLFTSLKSTPCMYPSQCFLFAYNTQARKCFNFGSFQRASTFMLQTYTYFGLESYRYHYWASGNSHLRNPTKDLWIYGSYRLHILIHPCNLCLNCNLLPGCYICFHDYSICSFPCTQMMLNLRRKS